MARTKLTPKLTLKPQPNDYSIVIKMGDLTLQESGATIPELLRKFKIEDFVGEITAVITHGDNKHEFEYLRPLYFRQVLESDEHKLLFEQRAKQLLGEIF